LTTPSHERSCFQRQV